MYIKYKQYKLQCKEKFFLFSLKSQDYLDTMFY